MKNKIRKVIVTKFASLKSISSVTIITLLLTSCSSHQQLNEYTIHNGCSILDASPEWREAYNSTYKKYGVPPHLVMAFIRQESSFRAEARPAPKTILGIKTGYASTAYGYPQAKDETWKWYKEKTGQYKAKRNQMPDAVDFIGWYVKANHTRSGVSKWEVEQQYYAYHDGMGGYERGTHLSKEWLLKVGQKVQNYAIGYRSQLTDCFEY